MYFPFNCVWANVLHSLPQVPVRVAEGDRLQVHSAIYADLGDLIHLKKVEVIGGEKFTVVGRPMVEGAYVVAQVEEHFQTKTMYMFRKALGRHLGGRWVDPVAQNTILRIKKIVYAPELKIEGKPGEYYKIENLPAEEGIPHRSSQLPPARQSGPPHPHPLTQRQSSMRRKRRSAPSRGRRTGTAHSRRDWHVRPSPPRYAHRGSLRHVS